MNYLRSTVVLASFASLALIAGCSADADVPGESTPATDVVQKGLEPQASSTSICVQDIGGTDKDAAFFQVQASRVSKYLFGGNDPFDSDPAVADSPEFGEFGKIRPDLGDSSCQKGADIIHRVHDKLYPASGSKCDPKLVGKDGRCPVTPPTASVLSGGLGTACYIPADSFGFSVSPQDADWPDMAYVAELLDGCWGKGISGFFWVKENVPVTSSNKERTIVNILGTDPEPADLFVPLSGGTGATAAAVYTNTGVATNVLLWPGYFVSGGSAPAGTPCSTWGLAAGDRTSKQIVLNASGTQRKCL